MKKLKKILSVIMAFAIASSLFSSFSVNVFAASKPDIVFNWIFANGIPITIEAGSDPTKTRIKYGNNQYLVLDNGQIEDDLSQYDIFGGSFRKPTNGDTSITMTGGKVGFVLGGGYENAPVSGNATINIFGNAEVRTVYGGGYDRSNVSGDATINITDATVRNYVYGGGTENSTVRNANITIIGGRVTRVYGAGLKNGDVLEDSVINISETTQISDIVSGEGEENSSVNGKKLGKIEASVKLDINSFTELIGRDEENNWHIKGDVTLNQGKKLIIATGSAATILTGAALTLEGTIINEGTLNLNLGSALKGNGKLTGNGKFYIAIEQITEDDIDLQTDYNYTGKIITPVHNINKKIRLLDTDFNVFNWKFETTDPAEVKNAGDYSLTYKREDANERVSKPFYVRAANQGGSIHLIKQDTNADGKVNIGDVLSVDMTALNPVGGTPSYSWKKKAGNTIAEVAKTNMYTIQLGDEGTEIYCEVVFSGNTVGTLRTDAVMPKLPAPAISFPMATAIKYGQKLKDSMLQGGSMEYGSFAWKNPDTVPTVNNTGYEVVFTANPKTIAKHEEITITNETIAVEVMPVAQEGNIRLIRQDTNADGKVNAGDILSVDMANLNPKGGTPKYSWKKKTATEIVEIGTSHTHTIQLGEEGTELFCVVEFSGNTVGSLQTDAVMPKLPAPVINFPTATEIKDGQKLKDSMLQGGSTEYGSFAWKNPDTIPTVDNSGYEVEFTASPETVAKYEPITVTVQKVAITVKKKQQPMQNSILASYIPEKEKKEIKPEKKITKEKGKISFVDVKPEDYFAEAVIWAVENGIAKGTSETTFSPYNLCTRAEMISFLWRADGSALVADPVPFRDVISGEYYSEAIKWAVKNQIVRGTDSNHFGPNLNSTRAQMISLLYRYAGSPSTNEKIRFVDVENEAYYAKAVAWALEKRITEGTGENTFSPNMECNRAQIITFLYRLFKN